MSTNNYDSPLSTEESSPITAETPEEAPSQAPAKIPPIVGIGASSGGLEAFSRLLERLPVDSGMAFVFVSHLAPTEHSQLAEILAGVTRMPVIEAANEALVEADHVYVIPPNATMLLREGRLALEPRAVKHPMPIDAFLRSLAFGRRSKAIGVILSGMGTDGALGVQAIKAEGGITFAQDVQSAQFEGMPSAAASTGCVDFVSPPDRIAEELTVLGRRLRTVYRKSAEQVLEHEDELRKVFALIRAAYEVDFTLYRRSTIKRRILRRMMLGKAADLREYVQRLKESPAELEALYQDILIKVTHFFRDPESFEALKQTVFPALLKVRAPDAPLRVWVPGCSTGEEAYSIAIALLEVIAEQRINVPIQIFATDVSEAALERARTGVYVENIAMDVSPERLRRFFLKSGNHYQISKSIRDICVFAKQNITRDPPFSKLDLISCRNVMIYLEPALQKRVLPVFHYALKPTGYLVLGASETVGGFSELFTLVDKRNKIHAKVSSPGHSGVDFASSGHYGLDRGERPEKPPIKAAGVPLDGRDVQREADRVVMNRYAPAGVIVNGDLQIVQFRGHTGPYLEPSPGEASLSVLKMARDGLMLELRAALHRAKRDDAPVRVEGLRVQYDGRPRAVNVEVLPLKGASGAPADAVPADRWFLVLFEEAERAALALPAPPESPRKKGEAPKDKGKKGPAWDVERLERELASTKEYLQVITEEQEATNEELQSANEELLSSNEELQSINEELETAKEELQSTNEELQTLNEELESRNGELGRVNNDLYNLLSSVNIPIVMLSSDLRIRRFTPHVESILNLLPSDLGRSIVDIRPKIDVPDLEQLVLEVIDTVSIREREVRDREGHWYSMRIRPYRTADNKIDGAVILFVDVDMLKRGRANGESGTAG